MTTRSQVKVDPALLELAGRVRMFFRGQPFREFMRDAAADLARNQRATIDGRELRPLSSSRIRQRIRNAPPRGIVVYGADHPLKATGQLYYSIASGVVRRPDGVLAAVVYTRNEKRVPEVAPAQIDVGVRLGKGKRSMLLSTDEMKRRARIVQGRAARRQRREQSAHLKRAMGPKEQVTNANLVRWHKQTGRDITAIPPAWLAAWNATLLRRLEAWTALSRL